MVSPRPIEHDVVKTHDDDAAPSVIAKVRLIVESFDQQHRRLGVSELARVTNLPKSTVYRLCQELQSWGLLQRRGKEFELGLRLFELGLRVPSIRTLRDVSLPYMEDLFVATSETIHLGVGHGTDVVYIEKITGHNPVRAPSAIGQRLPLYCTALGKAILAFSHSSLCDRTVEAGLRPRTPYTVVTAARLRQELDAVRQSGVAFEREESAPGIVCAAAPLLVEDETVVGAISVTASISKDPERLAPAVRAVAHSLSRALKGRAIGAVQTEHDVCCQSSGI